MCCLITSEGFALEKAYIVQPAAFRENIQKTAADSKEEITRFNAAIQECGEDLAGLMSRCPDNAVRDMMDFQIMLLSDDYFYGKIITGISTRGITADYALQETANQYIDYLGSLKDNPYLQARTSDIRDIARRIQGRLEGSEAETPPEEPYIAVAADLSPSWIVGADSSRLKGIILQTGGLNSHCSIIAQAYGIPCIVNVENILERVKTGDLIYEDAVEGAVYINPDEKTLHEYKKRLMKAEADKKLLQEYAPREARTTDGFRMQVLANIATEKDVPILMRQGADGVGLFRTEMFFMAQSKCPDEENQRRYYSSIAGALEGKPLIVRTLDVGGDKPIPYLPDLPAESNPFLGCRAIRYCLRHRDFFKRQIAAILQAGENAQLLFPMITKLPEVRELRQLVREVSEELEAQKKTYCNRTKVGVMIETPAAAFDAGSLAREVDFFSIGTNDLIQYLYAADRTNARVASLGSPLQPAFLRLIRQVVEEAHRSGIPVDVCGKAGEMAELIPLWIAMGIDAVSVSPSSVLQVKRQICSLAKSECVKILDEVLAAEDEQEVQRRLRSFQGIPLHGEDI